MTYSEGAELIGDIQDFLHVAANTADDPIDDMDHAVCGHLITVDDRSWHSSRSQSSQRGEDHHQDKKSFFLDIIQ